MFDFTIRTKRIVLSLVTLCVLAALGAWVSWGWGWMTR